MITKRGHLLRIKLLVNNGEERSCLMLTIGQHQSFPLPKQAVPADFHEEKTQQVVRFG